jgi:hypothetical protein
LTKKIGDELVGTKSNIPAEYEDNKKMPMMLPKICLEKLASWTGSREVLKSMPFM